MTSVQRSIFKKWDTKAIIHTNHGDIIIKLFPHLVPKTVANFIWLAEKWYYNNVVFHRVIPGFMIQWGDPTSTGMGGESLWGESFEDEFHKDLSNISGSISMANAWPNTNGSQFFINQVDNIYLDNRHSVFWQVMTWIDVVEKIASVPTDRRDKPKEDCTIQSITISIV